jgi:hypothetical protein
MKLDSDRRLGLGTRPAYRHGFSHHFNGGTCIATMRAVP